MTTFAPGTRVVVRYSGHLNGLTGVVIETPEGVANFDLGAGVGIAVLLDEPSRNGATTLGFYAHELQVAR